jgi:hypothetical protein
MTEPTWARVKYPKIDYQDIIYYSAPKSKKDGPKVRGHRGHRLALKTAMLRKQLPLCLRIGPAPIGVVHLGDRMVPGDHRMDPGHPLRGPCVHTLHLGIPVGAAQDRPVEHPRKLHVIII